MIAEGIRKSQTVTERGSTPRFATTIFRYSFKNLVNKAVGPGGWSVIK